MGGGTRAARAETFSRGICTTLASADVLACVVASEAREARSSAAIGTLISGTVLVTSKGEATEAEFDGKILFD